MSQNPSSRKTPGNSPTPYRPLTSARRASLIRCFAAFVNELEIVREALTAGDNVSVHGALKQAYRRFYRLAEVLMPGTSGAVLRPLTEAVILNSCRVVAESSRGEQDAGAAGKSEKTP